MMPRRNEERDAKILALSRSMEIPLIAERMGMRAQAVRAVLKRERQKSEAA